VVSPETLDLPQQLHTPTPQHHHPSPVLFISPQTLKPHTPVAANRKVMAVGLLRPSGQPKVAHAVVKHVSLSHAPHALDVCDCKVCLLAKH
jgi:hypothetical protein